MVSERSLTTDDVSQCLALSDAAGWNQVEDDWRFILERGDAHGLVVDGRIVATAAIMPYRHRFAWICMVLVAEDQRRRGHATHLLHWATEASARRGLVAGLDATPAGREVYRRMGFRDIYGLTRMETAVGHANRSGLARPSGEADTISIVQASDLAEIAAFDAPRFGADRADLLAFLYGRAPKAAFLARRNGEISGFCLARPGQRATQIGPVVATDENTAISLFAAGISALEAPIFCDVADRHEALHEFLRAHGLRSQRPFTRMLMDRGSPLDQPEKIFALTGPEFG